MLFDKQIEDWFTYHQPSEEQKVQLYAVRYWAKLLAYSILENCPTSADRTAAFRLLRECVMTANASIVLPQGDKTQPPPRSID